MTMLPGPHKLCCVNCAAGESDLLPCASSSSSALDYALERGDDALGDIACSPAETAAAESAVGTLSNVFAAAGAPARWKPYVDQVLSDWKAWKDALFFYWVCDAKEIGQHAEALTAQIASEAGLATPPGSPELDPGTLSTLGSAVNGLVTLGTVAGAILSAVWLWREITTKRRTTT